MPIATGTRMGPYEIVAVLGAGGMGEVYRARDTRLGREVAIKFLRARHDGHGRLLNEARAVSALNHPNILGLYDICSENGSEFLVMELVRGKTLDQLIGNRGIAVNEAVKYAIPIADALARAHAAGILHRDLKPSNIMITADGVPKILDFGLAQAAEPPTDGDETRSLTEGSHQLIVGTAAYMSPEQAEGKKLDARSDIFSFGAVLYEMITGRRAFRGDSTASMLAAVLHRDPDPPVSVPKELERIIYRCLRKDPNRRFQTMSDVRVELEEVREESESGMLVASPPIRHRRRAWIYAAGLAMLAVVAVIWQQLHVAPPRAPSQPVPLTAYLGDEDFPDFSPDDSQVVFAWNGGGSGNFHIYLKPIGSPNHLQLTKGNASETYPKWSPDGQWIAFQRRDGSGEHTFVMLPIGGSERKLHDGACRGLSWSSDSQALACGSDSGLILISVETGETHKLTSPQIASRDVSPVFSPDGRKLLFIRGYPNSDLYVLDLNKDHSPRGEPRRLTTEHANSLALTAGFVGAAWTQDGQDAIWPMAKTSLQAITLYRVPVIGKGSIQQLPYVGQPSFMPAVAHRRSRLVYTRRFQDSDIWRADGHIAERHPVSSSEADLLPQFSPDGKRMAFQSSRSGPTEIWVANTDGTEPVQLTHLGYSGSPRWSPDGRWIVFDADVGRGWEIWIVESTGGRPRRLNSTPGESYSPSFSHDGKWIYFSNDRTGRTESFRMALAGGAAVQLTHNGCAFPLESVNGRTIYCHESLPQGNSGSSQLYELYEAGVAGGPEHPLGVTTAFRSFQVTSDGIYFITWAGENGRGSELRSYDSATRQSRLIQTLSEVNTGFGLSVSPDRKIFLYTVLQSSGRDLMLVDNFR